MANQLNNLIEELRKLKNVKYNYTDNIVTIYFYLTEANWNKLEIVSKNEKYICRITNVSKLGIKTTTKEYSYLAPLLRYIIQFSKGKV